FCCAGVMFACLATVSGSGVLDDASAPGVFVSAAAVAAAGGRSPPPPPPRVGRAPRGLAQGAGAVAGGRVATPPGPRAVAACAGTLEGIVGRKPSICGVPDFAACVMFGLPLNPPKT